MVDLYTTSEASQQVSRTIEHSVAPLQMLSRDISFMPVQVHQQRESGAAAAWKLHILVVVPAKMLPRDIPACPQYHRELYTCL